MFIKITSTILKGTFKVGVACLISAVAATIMKRTVNETVEIFYQSFKQVKSSYTEFRKEKSHDEFEDYVV